MPKKRAEVTEEEIARRAYEISQSDECGSDEENWHRAVAELSAPPKRPSRARQRPAGAGEEGGAQGEEGGAQVSETS